MPLGNGTGGPSASLLPLAPGVVMVSASFNGGADFSADSLAVTVAPRSVLAASVAPATVPADLIEGVRETVLVSAVESANGSGSRLLASGQTNELFCVFGGVWASPAVAVAPGQLRCDAPSRLDVASRQAAKPAATHPPSAWESAALAVSVSVVEAPSHVCAVAALDTAGPAGAGKSPCGGAAGQSRLLAVSPEPLTIEPRLEAAAVFPVVVPLAEAGSGAVVDVDAGAVPAPVASTAEPPALGPGVGPAWCVFSSAAGSAVVPALGSLLAPSLLGASLAASSAPPSATALAEAADGVAWRHVVRCPVPTPAQAAVLCSAPAGDGCAVEVRLSRDRGASAHPVQSSAAPRLLLIDAASAQEQAAAAELAQPALVAAQGVPARSSVAALSGVLRVPVLGHPLPAAVRGAAGLFSCVFGEGPSAAVVPAAVGADGDWAECQSVPPSLPLARPGLRGLVRPPVRHQAVEALWPFAP
ncbi:hypothetical protein FNF28_03426 [Cafeteria roenbergensis]|nr:hypothetical protein FNF28_03426 [Cafeteria roenbergensis]